MLPGEESHPSMLAMGRLCTNHEGTRGARASGLSPRWSCLSPARRPSMRSRRCDRHGIANHGLRLAHQMLHGSLLRHIRATLKAVGNATVFWVWAPNLSIKPAFWVILNPFKHCQLFMPCSTFMRTSVKFEFALSLMFDLLHRWWWPLLFYSLVFFSVLSAITVSVLYIYCRPFLSSTIELIYVFFGHVICLLVIVQFYHLV